jgi:UPF0755 protein
MKKIALLLFTVLCLGAIWTGWGIFGPTVNDQQASYFYLPNSVNTEDLIRQLEQDSMVSTTRWARLLLKMGNIHHVKAGRYKINKGMSVFQLIKNLKNGKQSTVKLVINKVRTKEELAGLVGEKIDSKTDSIEMLSYLRDNDSLASFSVDTNQVLSIVMPLTYEISWAESPRQITKRFYQSWTQFWTSENIEKANKKGLNPLKVSTLASIVEEETNNKEDRFKIASTYLNRLKIGMKLQADPTVKYVTRNFKLNRIMYGHLSLNSPYNTYQNAGLPPGPICTPSIHSMQAVLDAPQTDFLFFVASWKFDGTTIFTSTYKDHQRYVKLFHDEQMKRIQ